MTIRTQEEFLEQYRALYGNGVTEVYKDEAISGTVLMHDLDAFITEAIISASTAAGGILIGAWV